MLDTSESFLHRRENLNVALVRNEVAEVKTFLLKIERQTHSRHQCGFTIRCLVHFRSSNKTEAWGIGRLMEKTEVQFGKVVMEIFP